ncbi:hypothetical protein [Hymenobacter sublimis]|uniref:Uncharacterized protein n=1 Tax=Hymenobacter sublimis TaxID=2933777 RepID=A0ABY4JBV6_9BACT|nr:hypothetical protein [Hymenobacter sublimis]UPL49262.1 hypothetical protein MWH26_19050 [Hymenobacter sublimis]
MKISTFAVLGAVLLLGTDVVAATAPLEETVTPVTIIPSLSSSTDAASHRGWIKRKKRRVTPAYRRTMRRR